MIKETNNLVLYERNDDEDEEEKLNVKINDK